MLHPRAPCLSAKLKGKHHHFKGKFGRPGFLVRDIAKFYGARSRPASPPAISSLIAHRRSPLVTSLLFKIDARHKFGKGLGVHNAVLLTREGYRHPRSEFRDIFKVLDD